MRILIYNWVQFDIRGEGGGVSAYLRQTVPELVNRGHTVTFLGAGRSYDGLNRSCRYQPTSNTMEGLGVRSYEIINSPVKAPAHDSVAILGECLDNTTISTVFTNFMKETGPYDLAVIHSIEGISTSVFADIKSKTDTPLVLFLHNYHLVCAQIELLRDFKTHCENYHDGKDCIGCFGYIADTRRLKLDKATTNLFERARLSRSVAGDMLRSTLNYALSLRRDVLGAWRGYRSRRRSSVELVPSPQPPRWQQSMELLDGGIEGLRSWSDVFRRWRVENVDRANRNAAAIITVSERAKAQLVQRGLNPDQIEVIHLGFDYHINAAARRERFLAQRSNEGALRLAFFGYAIPSKGLEFLIEALESAGPWAREVELLIFARYNDHLQRRLARLDGKIADVRWADGYDTAELHDILQNVDLGIIPSLCYETYSITAYELTMAGVPVLMSDSVGFAELIGDQRFQFKRGDSASLLARLEAFVKDRALLEGYWDDQERVPSLKQHMDRLIGRIEGVVHEHRSQRDSSGTPAPDNRIATESA